MLQTAPTGTSVSEQSQLWYDPADGVSAQTGDIGLRNVVVVAGSSDDASVLTAFANTGDVVDELVAVSIAGSRGELTLGPLALVAGSTTYLGYPYNDRVVISSVGDIAVPGERVDVDFDFANAASITVNTLVQPPDHTYLAAAPPGTEPWPVESDEARLHDEEEAADQHMESEHEDAADLDSELEATEGH